MERRYSSLRVVAGLVWFLGAITLIVGVIGALVAGATWGLHAGILGMLAGVLSAIFIIAGAESIKVIIDIEENTRHARVSVRESKPQ